MDYDRAQAVDSIEALVLSFLTQLSKQDVPKKIEIQLADRRKLSAPNGLFHNVFLYFFDFSRPYSSIPTRSIRFPQRTKGPSAKSLGMGRQSISTISLINP